MAGAFYAFLNIRQHLGKTYGPARCDNSAQWCLALLEQKNVATVMGSAFGAEGYARLSFAASMESLEAGLARIEEFIRSGK
jgi:aspartate aminotransferase